MPLAVTKPLAVIGAVEAKVVTAFTVSVWPPVAPRTTLPLAVTSPLAVTVAAEVKVVAAFTVTVCVPPLVPRVVLPATLKLLATVAAPVNAAVPEESMVRRSTTEAFVPAAVVLRIRLPP